MEKQLRSKFFEFHDWLSLSEAAEYLSRAFNEDFTKEKILKLAMNHHLKLSVNFINPVPAQIGILIPQEQVEYEKIEIEGEVFEDTDSIDLGDNRFLNLDKKIEFIHGVWGLVMAYGAELDIKNRYFNAISGSSITTHSHEGVFVERDKQVCRLQMDVDNIDIFPGSTQYMEKLKSRIENGFIKGNEAKEIWQRAKEARDDLRAMTNEERCSIFYDDRLPQDGVLGVCKNALEELITRASINDSQGNSIIKQQEEVSQKVSKPDNDKPHGNAIRFEQQRKSVLNAAKSAMRDWPSQCRSGTGKFEASKIAKLVDDRALLFWPDTGAPPLSVQVMARLISENILKSVE